MGRKAVSRRDFLQMAALAAAGMGVAACQPSPPAPVASEKGEVKTAEVKNAPVSSETVTISFMGWGGPEESQAVLDLIKKFESKNPDIKINWQHTPEDFMTKLLAMIAAGTPPDSLFTDQAYYKTFCKQGLLLDIQNYLDADKELDPDTYFLQPQEDNRSGYEGRWHGIGCCWVGYNIFYNNEMFIEAGIEPPSNDPEKAWEWDYFVDVCKKFTQDSKGRTPDDAGFDSNDITQWGVSFATWLPPTIPYLNGVPQMDPTGTKLTLDDPLAIDAYQKFADLLHKHHVAPLSQNFKDLGMSTTQMLENRKMAMSIEGSPTLASATKLKCDLGTACMPKMKQTGSIVVADVRAAMKATKYPEQAYKWVRMTADPDYQSTFLKIGLWWPNQTALMTPEGLTTWITERKAPGEGIHPKGYFDLVDKYLRKHTDAWSCPPGYSEALGVIYAGLDNIWNGSKTAELAITEMIGKANEALAKGGSSN
jgi:multiple sugar transport system substrate-binding protein